jgi:hypothetical protein
VLGLELADGGEDLVAGGRAHAGVDDDECVTQQALAACRSSLDSVPLPEFRDRSIHSLRGKQMPRGTSTTSNGRRRRTARARSDAGSVVGQITQLVTANETLKRENAELLTANERLRRELAEIGSALGSLTGGPRRRGRRGAELAVLAEAKPKRQRRPITDPELLERRRQALAKARAARAEKLAAAKEGANG